MKTRKFKIGDLIRPKKGVDFSYCIPGTYLYIADDWINEDVKYSGYFLTVTGDGEFQPFYKQWAYDFMELIPI